MQIVVDNDPLLKYERSNFFRSCFNTCLICGLNLAPAFLSRLVIKKSNQKAAKVQDNVASHVALDALYTTGEGFKKPRIIENIWFNLNNPRAVRNRLKLVKKLLERSINSRINNGQRNIQIVSLASGSARAVIETIKKFENKNDLGFKVKLIDKNPKALEASKKMIIKNNLPFQCFELINDNIRNFSNHCKNDRLDIIEMVGFLDYLNDEKAIFVLSKIHKNLTEDGILITANIRNNKERGFLEKVLKWVMVYREPADISKILTEAKFKADNIDLFYEPFLIHGVAIAKK